MRRIVRFMNVVHVALVQIAKALLIAMVLIIFANVVLRYVFNSGLVWSEEIALLVAVWFSFIGMAIGVKQKLHIHINLLNESFIPQWLNTLLWRIRDIVVIGVGIVFLYWGRILVQFTMRSIMPATRLPAGLLYLVIPISSVFIIYEGITDLVGIDTEDQLVDDYLLGTVSFSSVIRGNDDA